MKVLYLDCFAGISGDMLLGALVDAGADVNSLLDALDGMELGDYQIKFFESASHGFRGVRAEVMVEEEKQPHRHLEHITGIIDGSMLPDQVKATARGVFEILARAEGRVHGKPPERVHFHEVGAVDSIIDIVGVSFALYNLGIQRVVCSPLPLGSGYVRCHHGLLPVPAPATAELVRGMPLRGLDVEGELVTPTGAALVKALAESFGAVPAMQVAATGCGLGGRDYGIPNLLRVFIGNDTDAGGVLPGDVEGEEIVLLETSLDDMTPEALSHACGLMLSGGALDVFVTPVVMKKSRPGHLLTVICPMEDEAKLMALMFRETTTLGLRRSGQGRYVLPRKIIRVNTGYGEIGVKAAYLDGRIVSGKPEYEDCSRAAARHNATLREVTDAALRQFQERMK